MFIYKISWMEKEVLFEILNTSSSKTEALNKLGYNYSNGRLIKLLKDYANFVGFDLNVYTDRKKKFCLECGKLLRKGQYKFCSKYYQNKWYGQIVLESSWEKDVALYLDQKDIKWNRPKPIKWVDSNNKKHLYYPDFYLEEYNLYLDPKNEYCMQKDKEKMKVVSKDINVVYGNIEYVLNEIDKVK
jgi:hypothetical protein